MWGATNYIAPDTAAPNICPKRHFQAHLLADRIGRALAPCPAGCHNREVGFVDAFAFSSSLLASHFTARGHSRTRYIEEAAPRFAVSFAGTSHFV
jgi:hypothetical protein